MTPELPKTYDFKATEARIYAMWQQNGYFKPHNDPNQPNFDPNVKPFVISIPPPNVTGELHLGHAMFVSMEDLMIRYHRMKGYSTLWVPGTDHAGIATQLQVERQLAREGLRREDLGREAFIERVWQWKHKYATHITSQIRRLGASCDWERERFTLDDGLSKAVREAFVRLYERGLIYRGPRLINWSSGLKTAVSDLEVEYTEESGTLYYFKYMLKPPSPLGAEDGGQGQPPSPLGAEDEGDERPLPVGEGQGEGEYIPVATTRPETILADTAVAVHPEDPRYQKYIGRTVLVPILNREIPVIADEYVSREFGTGALKITPGHDPNDYAIGQRHNLPLLSMLDKEARVTEVGGPYAGQDRFEARKNLWNDMKTAGLVLREEAYTLKVPRSQRGGEIIEPMVSEQWFVKIQPLAQKAIHAVRSGKTRIIPDYFEKVYFNWLENIQDWCISRQLWWGHRIPVWHCADCAGQTCTREDPTHCAHCGSPNITQDPDVLDTWFSSGLWPFSTLGWPDNTPDLRYFYPTSIMETGYDILFFWVARMIMSGMEFTGEAPFHTVYLHGLIRDEHGQKMSKSKGNVIDPIIVMDDLGTDALRFTLLVGSTPGKDMNLSLTKVESNRNFINKLWNAGRLTLALIQKAPAVPTAEPQWTLADAWIWARAKELTRNVERLFQNHQYGEAGRQIYEFFWDEFADWYLEIAKVQSNTGGDRAFYTANLAMRIYDILLRLLHPFIPFVTEELWQTLKETCRTHSDSMLPQEGAWAEALIVARWADPLPEESGEAENMTEFRLFQEVVRAIRNLRAEKGIKPGTKFGAILVEGAERQGLYASLTAELAALAGLDAARIHVHTTLETKPEGHVALVVGAIQIYLPLAEMVDLDEARARLQKDLAEAQNHIARLEALLNSPFSQKARPDVVEKEREKLNRYRDSAQKILAQLQELA